MTEYYVSGVIEKDGNCEMCDDDKAQFWTLYDRDEKGESQAVADFTDKQSAQAIWQKLDNMEAAALAMRDLWREEQQQVSALAAENMELAVHIGGIAVAYETGMKDALAEEIDAAVNCNARETDAIKRQWIAEAREAAIHDAIKAMDEVGARFGSFIDCVLAVENLLKPEEKDNE